jgi:uncharacterized membrane protein YfcA
VLYAELLLFGICVGILSGTLGIGGGIVLVPGLVLLFHFSQEEAQGTSLATLSLPICIFAAMVYYQNGFVRLPVAAVVATGFVIGAYFGARLVPHVPMVWLKFVFGVLLLYLGFMFVFVAFRTSAIPARSMAAAALPAGVTGVITAVLAWLSGKRPPPIMKLPPPDGHTEYHI